MIFQRKKMEAGKDPTFHIIRFLNSRSVRLLLLKIDLMM